MYSYLDSEIEAWKNLLGTLLDAILALYLASVIVLTVYGLYYVVTMAAFREHGSRARFSRG